MPLKKLTESKLKKFKKDELITHIITLYDMVDECLKGGDFTLPEHKKMVAEGEQAGVATLNVLKVKIERNLRDALQQECEEKHVKIQELKEQIQVSRCLDEEIVAAEKLMRIFVQVEDNIGCPGCRLKRFHNFAIELIRDNKKMQHQLVSHICKAAAEEMEGTSE